MSPAATRSDDAPHPALAEAMHSAQEAFPGPRFDGARMSAMALRAWVREAPFPGLVGLTDQPLAAGIYARARQGNAGGGSPFHTIELSRETTWNQEVDGHSMSVPFANGEGCAVANDQALLGAADDPTATAFIGTIAHALPAANRTPAAQIDPMAFADLTTARTRERRAERSMNITAAAMPDTALIDGLKRSEIGGARAMVTRPNTQKIGRTL